VRICSICAWLSVTPVAALPDVPAGLEVDPAAPLAEPAAVVEPVDEPVEPAEPVEPVEPVRPFRMASIASMWRIASWFPAADDAVAAPELAVPVGGRWACGELCPPAAGAGEDAAASALLVLVVLAAPVAVEDAGAGDEPADGAVPSPDALGVFEVLPMDDAPAACSNCFR
jgi:hypothetical protein